MEVSSAEEGWRGCGACLRRERRLIGGGPIMGLFSCLGLIIGFGGNIDLRRSGLTCWLWHG
jgi:hypothetical protein